MFWANLGMRIPSYIPVFTWLTVEDLSTITSAKLSYNYMHSFLWPCSPDSGEAGWIWGRTVRLSPGKASQPHLWPAASKRHTCGTTPCVLWKQKCECSGILATSFPNLERPRHPVSKTGLGVNWSAQSPERCIEPCCAAKAVSWWIKKNPHRTV